jgi:hypothetical protein
VCERVCANVNTNGNAIGNANGDGNETQHENNAITLLHTNCLWLKHHDDPISILTFSTVWYIQSIYSVFQFWIIFLDTVLQQFSHKSIQKNNTKFEYRIHTLNIPNSIKTFRILMGSS